MVVTTYTFMLRSKEDGNLLPDAHKIRADRMETNDSTWEFYLDGEHVRSVPCLVWAFWNERYEWDG